MEKETYWDMVKAAQAFGDSHNIRGKALSWGELLEARAAVQKDGLLETLNNVFMIGLHRGAALLDSERSQPNRKTGRK